MEEKFSLLIRLLAFAGVLTVFFEILKWHGRQRAAKDIRGFSNISLINLSLRALFSRLSSERIRRFSVDFGLTAEELKNSDDPIIWVQKLARRYADHFGLYTSGVVVAFRSDLKAPGCVELSPSSEFFVDLKSDLRNSRDEINAILAHEITHIFLFRAGIQLEPTFTNEVLTDTTALFLGCGTAIINAASVKTRTVGNEYISNARKLGYLSVDEFGYVLAKRDMFFKKKKNLKIVNGLPRWGYQAGRRRLKTELNTPPYSTPGIYTLIRRLMLPKQKNSPFESGTVFACAICGQQMKIPILKKWLSVTCPTCREQFLCYS